jgi:hypothetical protein
MPDTFPLLFKEGWLDHFLIMIQKLIPAGVVDCVDSITASAELDLFLSDDLKNLRLFLLKRFLFFISIKVSKKSMNQPPRSGNKILYMPDNQSSRRLPSSLALR